MEYGLISFPSQQSIAFFLIPTGLKCFAWWGILSYKKVHLSYDKARQNTSMYGHLKALLIKRTLPCQRNHVIYLLNFWLLPKVVHYKLNFKRWFMTTDVYIIQIFSIVITRVPVLKVKIETVLLDACVWHISTEYINTEHTVWLNLGCLVFASK